MAEKQPGFPAGQHYVPKMLQKRFVGADGMLSAYDQRRADRRPFRSKPSDIFMQRHIYTVEGPDGTKSDSYERAIGIVEGAADPIIDQVVFQVRANGTCELSMSDRKILLLFISLQMRRVPEFLNKIQIEKHLDAAFNRLQAANTSVPQPISSQELDRLNTPSERARLKQAALMQAMLKRSPIITEALGLRGLTIAFIPRRNRRLILASQPIVRLCSPSGRTDLGDPQVELWLPIAPDVALVSSGQQHQSFVLRLDWDEGIRRISCVLARQSRTIASDCPDLLRSLVRACWGWS